MEYRPCGAEAFGLLWRLLLQDGKPGAVTECPLRRPNRNRARASQIEPSSPRPMPPAFPALRTIRRRPRRWRGAGTRLHPPIEPYAQRRDGYRRRAPIYYEQCGNPEGCRWWCCTAARPAAARRCSAASSTPPLPDRAVRPARLWPQHASRRLANNDTAALLRDIEQLRRAAGDRALDRVRRFVGREPRHRLCRRPPLVLQRAHPARRIPDRQPRPGLVLRRGRDPAAGGVAEAGGAHRPAAGARGMRARRPCGAGDAAAPPRFGGCRRGRHGRGRLGELGGRGVAPGIGRPVGAAAPPRPAPSRRRPAAARAASWSTSTGSRPTTWRQCFLGEERLLAMAAGCGRCRSRSCTGGSTGSAAFQCLAAAPGDAGEPPDLGRPWRPQPLRAADAAALVNRSGASRTASADQKLPQGRR